MKLSLFTISLLLAAPASAFVSKPSFSSKNHLALNAVELKPEPEGGEEIMALKTMEGSKMKNMGEAEGVKSDDGTAYTFWLSATAQSPLIKKLNTEVMKNAAKKAEFPGFRKVRVLNQYVMRLEILES